MRLLEGYSTLYTSLSVRVTMIGAKLVCLSITSKQAKVALECCQAIQGWKWRCPLTFTPPSRLLCLGAMDSEWKMLSNSIRWTCLGAPECLQWNSAVSSGAETLEADSQELCSWPYPFYLMRYWNLLWCQWLSSISSTSHSASPLTTMGGGWFSVLRLVIRSFRAGVSFTTLNTGWSCFIQCGSLKQ